MSFDGENIINGGDGFDRMIFQGDFDYYAILPPLVTGDSSTQIIDFVPNRDGTNYLFRPQRLFITLRNIVTKNHESRLEQILYKNFFKNILNFFSFSKAYQ